MKRLMGISVILLLIFAYQNVFSQGRFRGGDNDFDGHPRRDMMYKYLNLTEDQQSKVTDLRLAFQKEIMPIRTQMHDLQTKIKMSVTEENFDDLKLDNLLKEKEKLATEMQKRRINHFRDIRSVLTVDQKKEFDLHFLSGKGFGKGGGKFHGRY
jgi:Spy/CpxP family protein refolding chaperone